MKASLRSFLVVTLLLVPAARAGDLFVPGDFATIQEAIDAAVDDDVIHVGPGTWLGPIDLHDKSIRIRGAGMDLTILDGAGAAEVVRAHAPVGAPSYPMLEALTVTGGGTGIAATGVALLEAWDCALSGNSGAGSAGNLSGGGLRVEGNGGAGISIPFDSISYSVNGTFSGNGGWGLEFHNAVISPYFNGCRFLGNGLGGARLTMQFPVSGPLLIVERCLFVGDRLQVSSVGTSPTAAITQIYQCTFDGGSIKGLQGQVDVSQSILRGTTLIPGVAPITIAWSDVEGGAPGVGNIDADPLWADAAAGDYTLLPGSPCINSGDPADFDLDGTIADMGAYIYQAWTDLGGAVAGSLPLPHLDPQGSLEAGDVLTLYLNQAKAGAAAIAFVGLAELGVPFKGGTLWPAPTLVIGPLAMPAGHLTLTGTWPPGLPAGTTIWTQIWWPDAAAPAGWAASNGVKGVAP